jgi:hypothetical protein
MLHTQSAQYPGHYGAKDGIVRVLHKRDHLLVSYDDGDPGLEFAATGEREFFHDAGNVAPSMLLSLRVMTIVTPLS